MGRKSLGDAARTARVQAMLTSSELAALERARGAQNRSDFIRDVLRNYLTSSETSPASYSERLPARTLHSVHTEVSRSACRHGKQPDYCKFCG